MKRENRKLKNVSLTGTITAVSVILAILLCKQALNLHHKTLKESTTSHLDYLLRQQQQSLQHSFHAANETTLLTDLILDSLALSTPRDGFAAFLQKDAEVIATSSEAFPERIIQDLSNPLVQNLPISKGFKIHLQDIPYFVRSLEVSTPPGILIAGVRLSSIEPLLASSIFLLLYLILAGCCGAASALSFAYFLLKQSSELPSESTIHSQDDPKKTVNTSNDEHLTFDAAACERMLGALKATSRARDQIDQVLQEIQHMLLITDATGLITDSNSSARSFFRQGPRLRGRAITTLFQLQTDHSHLHIEGVMQAHCGNKGTVTVEVTKTILESPDSLEYLYGIRDVTVQQEIEHSLRRAKVEAETLAEMKSNFIANMSHEIRTPLNGIIGLSELLLDTPLNDEQSELFEGIQCSAQILLKIVNDVLDFSKVEVGKLELQDEVFSLENSLRNLEKLFHYQVESKEITFVIHQHEAVPKNLYGDSLRLEQILINLVGNAIKFTTWGGAVCLFVEPATDIEHGLSFSIIDTGIGIPEEQQELIFHEFSQGDTSTTREFGGTGLGLAIASRLVEWMGGSLTLNSQPMVGSSFQFSAYLPEATDFHYQETDTPYKQNCTKKLHVLLVEDNKVNAKLAASILQRAGHRVTTAENGMEAVEAFKTTPEVDLILMDIQMPVMGGCEAFLKIRQHPQGLYVPIIALTAHALESDAREYIVMGMDGYLSKPFKGNELLSVIDKTLQTASKSKEDPLGLDMP